MAPMLSEFFDAMVHKLNVNSHKRAITDDDIDGLLVKMATEIAEFQEQRHENPGDPNMLAELADISNFSFLLFAFLRNKGVQDLREQFLSEFFTIDPERGRVFCKRTRAGSRLRVGDEVEGTERNGVVYIRAQHSISGATISLPRRDVIWWYSTGKWPDRPLVYRDLPRPGYAAGHATPDQLVNLMKQDAPPPAKPPFVTRYAPKGKEGGKNYGRYVYQRRHRLKLVRVGYWDTPEDAACEGLKKWKEKTRGD